MKGSQRVATVTVYLSVQVTFSLTFKDGNENKLFIGTARCLYARVTLNLKHSEMTEQDSWNGK